MSGSHSPRKSFLAFLKLDTKKGKDMKKKIIVFALSIILSVIGICAAIGYVVDLWTSKPAASESDLFSGIASFASAVVSFGTGYIAIIFPATALILEIYCIKFCTGVMRSVSIVLCVLCALALASSLISFVIYFIISRNPVELLIPAGFFCL